MEVWDLPKIYSIKIVAEQLVRLKNLARFFKVISRPIKTKQFFFSV